MLLCVPGPAARLRTALLTARAYQGGGCGSTGLQLPAWAAAARLPCASSKLLLLWPCPQTVAPCLGRAGLLPASGGGCNCSWGCCAGPGVGWHLTACCRGLPTASCW